MPNRLAQESSPYLLQHAHNPVDWYPWGEEAFAKAKAEDKPIFLSIGYAACHWCHVMERESFEDTQTAAVMNDLFINIKVDREERPDLDTIYMDAVVAMTGRGGWPMSVFLTPQAIPYYGGTYFPPTHRQGMPGFVQVLRNLAHIYHHQKEDIITAGGALVARMQATLPLLAGGLLDPAVLELAAQALGPDFDWTYGGFGRAPKFPQPMTYDFLLRAHHRTGRTKLLEMVELTLHKMAQGGMYDQLGGGFHRYSVDPVWLVPHFEKMLYDNALLARLYLHAYQVTGRPFYRRVVTETLDYVAREMTAPNGGFYSTQDADSEGEEGKFFLWTPTAIKAILGDTEGEIFCAAYDVKPDGNFEGKSILHLPTPLEQVADVFGLTPVALDEVLAWSRAQLLAAREKRVKPARDEKVLTAWNGLMLAAFAEAARVLKRPDYERLARANADFVLSKMLHEGRLYRVWNNGQAKLMGYLEDYAAYADGLLALYQTTFDPRWFDAARALLEVVLAHFPDAENGGFFDTADDHEPLVARPKSLQDNAIPCGNSLAVRALLMLAAYTGEARYETPAIRPVVGLQRAMSQHPGAFAHWLGTLEFVLAPPKEVAVIGHTVALQAVLFDPYRPNQVVALAASEEEAAAHPPLAHHRSMQAGQATAYVCQNFTCRQPVTTPEELAALL